MKKELCILHIGMPKTGSTTIQNFFFQNEIDNSNVEYLKLDTSNHGQRLRAISMTNKEDYYFFQNKNFTQKDIEDFTIESKKMIEKSIALSNKKTLLISGEDLYHATPIEIKKLKFFLEKYFNKIVIVVYVRPVKYFCESAFQQLVKFHNLNSLKRDYIYPQYKKILNYMNKYGEDNIKILPFVPGKFYKNDLLKDFCYNCQIEEQESVIKKANETLSKEAISVLFTYNLHENIHVDYKINNIIIHTQLIDKFKNFGKEKFKFSGKLIQSWIDQFYKEDYNWLLSKIDEKYKEDFLLDPNEDGISHKNELLEYSVTQIEALVELVKDKKSIGFPLEKHPQTVAKLVNIIRSDIAVSINLNGGKNEK